MSIQEAMNEIAGLDQVICLDYLTDVNLGKALDLQKDSDKSVDKRTSYQAIEIERNLSSISVWSNTFRKNKAYLNDFYRAKSERAKTMVLQRYSDEKLGMTANIAFDKNHSKFDLQYQ